MKNSRSILIWFIVLLLVSQACGLMDPTQPSRNAVVIEVAANTSLSGWLSTAVQEFNQQKVKLASGKPVYVTLSPVEAGQAVVDIQSGQRNPAVWIPDDPVWVQILADQGNSAFETDCSSVASSPLVIGMWRTAAESLGWPGRKLGWLDIGSLAADPSSWVYYTGGQYGAALRLGHTHPGLSGSGAYTLLAIVQAAQPLKTAISPAEVDQPIVQASLSAFEGAVSWFSSDTDQLGRTMQERGVGYLGAAVLYESTVVQYSGSGQDIVPIYPFEGTFVASHPACINTGLDAAQQEAAAAFRGYLLGSDAQESAHASGLRPPSGAASPAAPLDNSHGVDLSQPETVFEISDSQAVYAVQSVWQSARKPVNLVMLIDVSGSMEGDKIEKVQEAAIQFINQMGKDDYLTLVSFAGQKINPIIDHLQVGEARQRAVEAVGKLRAAGSTPLYDALGYGADVIDRTHSSQTTNALVVLTDGMDTSSERFGYNQNLIEAVIANNTTVFTIAYGSDADVRLLSDLAQQANGNFYQGDEASIAAIYQEMSAAFGGAVGVGR